MKIMHVVQRQLLRIACDVKATVIIWYCGAISESIDKVAAAVAAEAVAPACRPQAIASVTLIVVPV